MLHSGSTKHRSPHWRKWWGAFSSLYRRGDGATCNTMAHGASVTILAKAVARLRLTILTERCAKHHDLGNRDSNANTGHHTGESGWAPPAHYTDEVTGWGERRHHRSGVSKAPVHYVTKTGIIKVYSFLDKGIGIASLYRSVNKAYGTILLEILRTRSSPQEKLTMNRSEI